MMQGIFCLGLIWRMDPYQMPRGFCVAQTVVIATSAYILAAVASTFSGTMSLAVLRPRGWTHMSGAALEWRPLFSIPVIIFPSIATAVHIALLVKFDAVQPTDDLHCDASNPEWIRFFGYAAMPFFLALPCTILSIMALVTVHKSSRALRRIRFGGLFSQPSSLGTRSIEIKTTIATSVVSHPSADGAYEQPPIPLAFSSNPDKKQKSPSLASPGKRPRSSSTIPVFRAPMRIQPTNSQSLPDDNVGPVMDAKSLRVFPGHEIAEKKHDKKWQNQIPEEDSEDIEGKTKTLDRRAGLDLDTSLKGDFERGGEEAYVSVQSSFHHKWADVSRRSQRLSPPDLTPAFWRMIIFQVLFSAVQVLACLSTIIDVARHRPRPTPFGLQHIALLLAAWGPTVIFGRFKVCC
ncbi:hypothetical protein AX15_005615 [Amanita polypyramis BW_CC]|nr:hypothetical protein AX15_005615 [Amanita polypyramis BW_CC]